MAAEHVKYIETEVTGKIVAYMFLRPKRWRLYDDVILYIF